MKTYILRSVFFLLYLTAIANITQAQKIVPHDTTYFKSFPHSLTVRIYGIHKYGEFIIPSSDNTQDIKYVPNTKFSVGAGFTYNNFTLNGALGFGFINKDNQKGETKSFNFQAHAYPNKWTVDLLASFHKGEYILSKGFDATDANSYYTRADVKSDLAGIAAYHISNSTKFSYRAAMVQNEWQTKSAGTLLLGGQAYYAALRGDSSLVPFASANSFKQTGIDKINVITFGPGIGYAYTLVAAQHVYIMGSLIGNVDVNITKEYIGSASQNKVSVEPAAIYKAAIGYNSASWGIDGIWAGNAILFKGASYSKPYFLPTGLFSVAINKKIFLKK
jgi:hypothetical protein